MPKLHKKWAQWKVLKYRQGQQAQGRHEENRLTHLEAITRRVNFNCISVNFDRTQNGYI